MFEKCRRALFVLWIDDFKRGNIMIHLTDRQTLNTRRFLQPNTHKMLLLLWDSQLEYYGNVESNMFRNIWSSKLVKHNLSRLMGSNTHYQQTKNWFQPSLQRTTYGQSNLLKLCEHLTDFSMLRGHLLWQ